ncbi:cytochrome b/b6 domain-containing protein [Spirulina major]|uniref:cytochrome b/b6 domain-containing protein n=1 Tax=Spirulina major TaxID=270636 RepID=UPI00093354C0|nr:cytochrome b/b6 domain-containing protein [Spirulina major]
MSAKFSHLYQPLLLRIIHAGTGLATLGAMVTAYWTYEVYDRRWGSLGWPRWQEVEGIHGTFGLWSLLLLPVLLIYAVHRGSKRLVQPDFLAKVGQIPAPIAWYTLHRFANTMILVALGFAVFSGKMMSEKWLPQGELDHFWYFAHLLSWAVMLGAIAFHLLMTAKVGGVPLLVSVWRWPYRPKDSPRLWWGHAMTWRQQWRSNIAQAWRSRSLPLKILETTVLLMVILGWGLSLWKEFGPTS